MLIEAVEDVAETAGEHAVFLEAHDGGGDSHEDDPSGEFGAGAQVDLLAARVAHGADHEHGDEQEEGWQREGPAVEGFVVLGEVEQEKHERGHGAGGGGHGQTDEVLVCFLPRLLEQRVGDDVEAREANGGGEQINEAEQTAETEQLGRALGGREDEEVNHQRRREAEGDDVGEGVEFGAEERFATAHARQAAVESVETHREKDVGDGPLEVADGGGGQTLGAAHGEIGLDAAQAGGETAEEISRRHQVGQKIDAAGDGSIERRLVGFVDHGRAGRRGHAGGERKVGGSAKRRGGRGSEGEDGGGLLGERFEVFPEFGMLLDQLSLGDGQAVAEEEIFQRVVLEDVEHVKGALAVEFEIVAQFVAAQAKEGFAGAHEFAERFARMGELFRLEIAHGLDGGELGQRIELFEFAQSLGGKGYLEHMAGEASAGPWARQGWRGAEP